MNRISDSAVKSRLRSRTAWRVVMASSASCSTFAQSCTMLHITVGVISPACVASIGLPKHTANSCHSQRHPLYTRRVRPLSTDMHMHICMSNGQRVFSIRPALLKTISDLQICIYAYAYLLNRSRIRPWSSSPANPRQPPSPLTPPRRTHHLHPSGVFFPLTPKAPRVQGRM